MKLIIDIPDYNLDEVQNGSIASGQIIKAVKNGIPYEERPQVVIFSENMTEEEKQKLIAEFKAVIDNAKFTVEPERPKGKWLIEGGTTLHYACSECGCAGDEWDKFCKHCGADMRGENK